MGWCCAVRKDCDICAVCCSVPVKKVFFYKVFEQFPKVGWWCFGPADAEKGDFYSVL